MHPRLLHVKHNSHFINRIHLTFISCLLSCCTLNQMLFVSEVESSIPPFWLYFHISSQQTPWCLDLICQKHICHCLLISGTVCASGHVWMWTSCEEGKVEVHWHVSPGMDTLAWIWWWVIRWWKVIYSRIGVMTCRVDGRSIQDEILLKTFFIWL